MPRYAIERTVPVLVAVLAWLVPTPAALATPGGGNSAATITASFADSCRDFAARSSKDISHVETHYLDGRVVKDESIGSPDHAIDGGAGDEIDFAIVKSGTTGEQFDCVLSNHAPTAVLEIRTPPIDQALEHCYDFFSGGLLCEQASPRTVWTAASVIPDSESAFFNWGCGALTDPALCSWTMSFRGTASSDPDGDISSWSIDFGDGTSASGSWSTAPPMEVTHAYSGYSVVTLTVTDSAGQSHSDTLEMVFLSQSPD